MAKERYGKQTADLINGLYDDGIRKFSVIMRHSARFYDNNVVMEPFMHLTEEGQQCANQFGKDLPIDLSLRFFSSYIGRCIETAYLIERGALDKKGDRSEINRVSRDISPFYIMDYNKLIRIILTLETPAFIRNWINGKYPETIIMNAKESVDVMQSFIRNHLLTVQEPGIDIHITHDWNIFILKELGLSLPHEDYGKVEYLEGIVFFEKQEELYMTHHQTQPKKLA